MPIYVRAGAIIPVDPVRQYTSEPVKEPTTLKVYRGADGQYTLYEDDGISQEYLKGRGSWTRMTWNDRSEAADDRAWRTHGRDERRRRAHVQGAVAAGGCDREVTYAGKRLQMSVLSAACGDTQPGLSPGTVRGGARVERPELS